MVAMRDTRINPTVLVKVDLMKTTKPCRSGTTGMRPFGSLGPRIDVEGYSDQFREKIAAVRKTLEPAIRAVECDTFESPPTHHRHRVGPLAVLKGAGEAVLEMAMWDPVTKAHSIVVPDEVPLFSDTISIAMNTLRSMPLLLDDCLPAAPGANVDPRLEAEYWGVAIGSGLRSVQFHSTLSQELMVCFVYFDERLKTLKRGELLPGEEKGAESVWLAAARVVRQRLLDAFSACGLREATVDVVGRWRRRRLAVERTFVQEQIELADGRCLLYNQPEGQFSNPNAPCEVHCLDWLSRQARSIVEEEVALQKVACPTCGPMTGGVNLLELHCGGGCNTVALAPLFQELIAVEINRKLAEAAEENLRTNGISNVKLIRCPSAHAQQFCNGAAAVLVDPPRAGLDDETLNIVARFDHILYISCNPAALCRDLQLLSEHEVVNLAIFDMFPYTTHSECSVRLRRSGLLCVPPTRTPAS